MDCLKFNCQSKSVNFYFFKFYFFLILSCYLDNLAGLYGQRGEVSSAVDRYALTKDGVQTPHLIPRQHAHPPTLLRDITGGHDDRRQLDVQRECRYTVRTT